MGTTTGLELLKALNLFVVLKFFSISKADYVKKDQQ